MDEITHSDETGNISQQSSVKRGKELQRQSTSQKVLRKKDYNYLIQ